MASEFHTHESTPRVDPYRWKPLVFVIPGVIATIVLAFIEILLVGDLLTGKATTRAWIEAITVGAMLAFLLGGLAVTFWRWWNRAVGDVAVARAQAAVVQSMPAGLTEFLTPQPVGSLPGKAAYAAMPAACLGLALVGLLIGEWLIVWISLGATVACGGLMALIFAGERENSLLGLSVDPARKVVIFENFTFAAKFFPNKPSPRAEVAFEEIIDCTYWPGQKGGPATLRLRTTRGQTDIYDRMPGFDALRVLLENLAILNQADTERHQANLQVEPRASVPVSGWAVILIAVAGLGLWIWLLLNL
jgi:hypothetical protein